MARQVCGRCKRPIKFCLCLSVSPQSTASNIQILQHSDETEHPFTTARIAAMGASGVRLFTGVDFPSNYFKPKAEAPSYLLYAAHQYGNRDASQDIELDYSSRSIVRGVPLDNNAHEPIAGLPNGLSVFVLDGSWRNTRELLLRNDWLTQLPVISLTSMPKSIYRLRKSSMQDGVSTIEALSVLLGLLERNFDSVRYLSPLRELLNQQARFESPS